MGKERGLPSNAQPLYCPAAEGCYEYTLFLIKTRKFWPSLVVLKFLHDLSLIVLSLFLIFVEIILP